MGKSIYGEDDRLWIVEGSTGKSYFVRYKDREWHCTCPGYKWRKKCRHITEHKAEVMLERKVDPRKHFGLKNINKLNNSDLNF